MIALRQTTNNTREPPTGRNMQAIGSILFIACASFLAARPAYGQSGCAGMWSVSIQTNNLFSCNPGLGHRVLIDEKGVIGPDRPGHHYQVFGHVAGCKKIKFTVIRESEMAIGTGEFSGGIPSGKWNVESPPVKKKCSGTWSAQRSVR